MQTKLKEDVFYSAENWPDRPVPRPRGAMSALELLSEGAASDLLGILQQGGHPPHAQGWWLSARVKNTVVEGCGSLRRVGEALPLGPSARLLTFPAFSSFDATERWESGGWDGYNYTEASVSFAVWVRRQDPQTGAWANVAALCHLHADAPPEVSQRSPAIEGTVDLGPRATLNWGIARTPEEFARVAEQIDVEGYNGHPARTFFERVAKECPQWELLAPVFYALREKEALLRAATENQEDILSLGGPSLATHKSLRM